VRLPALIHIDPVRMVRTLTLDTLFGNRSTPTTPARPEAGHWSLCFVPVLLPSLANTLVCQPLSRAQATTAAVFSPEGSGQILDGSGPLPSSQD
jgi:hypothetical protein